MKEINPFERNILYTIAYFNAMNYALTPFELWRFFISEKNKRSSYSKLFELINDNSLKKYISFKKGFIVLKGCEKFIEMRLENQKISMINIKKIRRWATIFRFIPFARGVFVTGTLSMKNARTQSDWDILLVLANNRIWIGRLFVGVVLHIFGKRRHGKKVARRFCLNHYVTENGLTLEEHSNYCAYFTTFSFPVIGGRIHKRFLQSNEHWAKIHFSNYQKDIISESDIINIPENPTIFQNITEKSIEFFGLARFINQFAKKKMIERIELNPKTHLEYADIRYSDCALVFLPKPHRIEVAHRAKEMLTNVIR